ncbi:hypothetical protein JYP46_14465, partial [Nitratireductor aquimarinus]|uniref:hypothetical protein n=1 Tax=Alphaproteobacteria TaxID=28211 RepID=UPI0019D391B8
MSDLAVTGSGQRGELRDHTNGAITAFCCLGLLASEMIENGGGKLDHGSGWIVLLRAAEKSSTFSLFCLAQGGTRDL